MIFVATKTTEGELEAFFSKNKKKLQEMGFQRVTKFDSEQRAIVWVNENYLFNIKTFLYD